MTDLVLFLFVVVLTAFTLFAVTELEQRIDFLECKHAVIHESPTPEFQQGDEWRDRECHFG